MISDPEPVGSEPRLLPGIKDVEQFPTGKELWIVLREPVNLDRLRKQNGQKERQGKVNKL